MRRQEVIRPEHKGLVMSVYRSHNQCTMGPSSRVWTIWVASDYGMEDASFRGWGHITREEAERLGLPLFCVGRAGGANHVRPIVDAEESPWFMYGGNIAHTSDSRGSWHPLKIHDRTEDGSACVPYYAIGEPMI